MFVYEETKFFICIKRIFQHLLLKIFILKVFIKNIYLVINYIIDRIIMLHIPPRKTLLSASHITHQAWFTQLKIRINLA